MFDIGFLELLVIAVVLLLVMGPERLPEVAKQAAFFIRKARQGMYRLRSEMKSEIDGTPLADIETAKREMMDLKNDIKQFGRDLADSVEKKSVEKKSVEKEPIEQQSLEQEPNSSKASASDCITDDAPVQKSIKK